jgi:cell division transport system ATP-binding protein
VFGLFQRINASGTSVLMATHDSEIIRQHRGIRVIELEDGRLVFDSAAGASA